MCNALFTNFLNIFSFHHYVDFLPLTYTSYSFMLLHYNVIPSNFTFDIFFADEIGHENYMSLIISICYNFFEITFIHTFNQLKVSSKKNSTSNYHLKVHLYSMFIQIFHPFCNFFPCTYGFHLV